MKRNESRLAVSCVSLSLAVVGCASARPNVLDFGVRRVTTDDRAKVLESAGAVLIDLGFALEQRDADAGVLVYSDELTSAASETYRFTSSMKQRRVVEIRVQGVPTGHKVFVRVSIQDQTTQAHRALAFGRIGDDRPGTTAIDRGAGATAEQSAVWQTVKRDKPTEQKILAAITARSGRVVSPKR